MPLAYDYIKPFQYFTPDKIKCAYTTHIPVPTQTNVCLRQFKFVTVQCLVLASYPKTYISSPIIIHFSEAFFLFKLITKGPYPHSVSSFSFQIKH